MSILNLLVFLIIVGLGLWLVGLIPMDATIAKIIRVVVIVFVCVYLVYFLVGYLPAGGYPMHRVG